jgi:predicted acetyltransferase
MGAAREGVDAGRGEDNQRVEIVTPGHAAGPVPGPRLSAPSQTCQQSFLEALLEYHAEGLHLDLDPAALATEGAFSAWTEQVRHDGLAGAADEPRDRVPHRVLWWVDGETYLGVVRIGLRLNDELLEYGGHVGYDVRPSARGRGHATALLAAALEEAALFGLTEVLLTCAPENSASQRVIERNGGRLVDVSTRGRLRYWCATTSDPTPP